MTENKDYLDGVENTEIKSIADDYPVEEKEYGVYKYVKKNNILLFDGRYTNLNNLSTRSIKIAKLRDDLLADFSKVCEEDAKKQGKNRNHFALYEMSLLWLTQFLNSDNIICKTVKNKDIPININEVKDLLKNSRYNLSEANASTLIKCAKKADILRQKGRGAESYFIVNPILFNGSFVGKISKKVFIEFNIAIKELFPEKQFNMCIDELLLYKELPNNWNQK